MGSARRWIQPTQLIGPDTPARQLQGQTGQIGLEDLGATVGRQLIVLSLGPQPVAHPRLQTPCSTGALGSAGARNALGLQTRHAAAGVEPRNTRQTGVNDHAYTVDGETGLGDVGGQHHLAQALGAGSMAAR